MSFDSLQEKIIQKKNPAVAGLDPRPEQIPPHILKEAYGAGTARPWRGPPRRCGSSTRASWTPCATWSPR